MNTNAPKEIDGYTWGQIRFEMMTSELLKIADEKGIKLSTREGKHKPKIAHEIWAHLKGKAQ